MATQKKARSKDPSYKKMKGDYFPVQRTIALASTSPSATALNFIDVGESLSNVNHRIYRQGKSYTCKVDLDNTATLTGAIEVYALVDTWYIQKAWQLAMQAYQEATADERANMSESKIARWEDFRVSVGMTANRLRPYRYNSSLTGARDTDGEITISEVTLADGTERTFTWSTSPAANEFSILGEYDSGGQAGQDPTESGLETDNPYGGLQADVHDSQSQDLATRGNQPPYNRTSFGSHWMKVATLANDGNGSQRLTTGFFNAPCGLVVLRAPTADTVFTGQVSLTVKAGAYKGTAGHNMG